jgi:phosphoribosylanthranilate isomerase
VIPVKICGLTREADVDDAVEAGAAAIGVVLWSESPRAVTAERATALMRRVPTGIARVGVFVNASAEEILRAVESASLDVAQLHGDEPLELVRALVDHVRVLRAVSDGPRLAQAAAWSVDESRVGVLVDAHDPARRGGTGTKADWPQAAVLAARRPIVLAGGLSALNVREATLRVHPAALDVSSGVEQAAGLKDKELMNALLTATKTLTVPGTTNHTDDGRTGFLEAVFPVARRGQHS